MTTPCQRIAALCAMLLSLSAQGQTPVPPIRDDIVIRDHFSIHAARFEGKVTGVYDIPYTSTPGFRPVRMDLYLPQQTTAKQYPFIIFVHDGRWQGGNARSAAIYDNWPQALASVAAKGYVVASVDYRLSGEVSHTGALDDIKDSIRWIHTHAKQFHINPDRGLLWGVGAGGQLAAMAATTCGIPTLGETSNAPEMLAQRPPMAASDCVQGAVIWSGVMDMMTMKSFPETAQYLDCEEDCDEERKLASPLYRISNKMPPFLLIHGTEDTDVPFQQSATMHSRMQEAGSASELIALQGIRHGFTGKTPEKTREAATTAWNRTMQFIAQTIGYAPARTPRRPSDK